MKKNPEGGASTKGLALGICASLCLSAFAPLTASAQRQQRNEGPKPPRDDRQKPPREDTQRPPRDDGQKPPQEERQKPPREDRQKPPRDDTRRPPRDDGQKPPQEERQKPPREDRQKPPGDGQHRTRPPVVRSDDGTPGRVAQPRRDIDRRRLIDPERHGRDIEHPKQDGAGRAISEKLERRHPKTVEVAKIVKNKTIINNITVINNDIRYRDYRDHWFEHDGIRYVYRYDRDGYHSWGWYWGSHYYWTRHHDGYFWWYDPYWHRWCYWREGYWWWHDPVRVEHVYVYQPESRRYDRYESSGGSVVTVPDTTPPVEQPPVEDAPVPETGDQTFTSEDGTRSVVLATERRDAYLYDLSIPADDPKGRGRYLATGVKDVRFVTLEGGGEGGGAVRQIELTFEDGTRTAVVDPEGERKVQTFAEKGEAYLYNLKDESVEPVFLAEGVRRVELVNTETAGGGRTSMLILAWVRYADGTERAAVFDRDGKPFGAVAEPPVPAAEGTGTCASSACRGMEGSATFQGLLEGGVAL